MDKVYAGAENVISSMGYNMEENVRNILAAKSGIIIDGSTRFTPGTLPLSLVNKERLDAFFHERDRSGYTILEKMFILSIRQSLAKSNIDATGGDTLFIISTTKGNIHLLDPEQEASISRERIQLNSMAEQLGRYFNNPNPPLVVSNACVSGVAAIIFGSRYIRSGKYRNVIVSGGDLISEFVVSGFQSFQSLSMKACKPFDEDRDGLTLGEGCGSIILSGGKEAFQDSPCLQVLGGAGSNDANHISGPSRTGEGLQIAIRQALQQSMLAPADIDTISAHGTATDYNDEMEAKAFSSAGLEKVPLNSYKGYIGHTLGAAGVIESAFSMQALKQNLLIASLGYGRHGVSRDINVIRDTVIKEINTCLKTASGFGGSNAAVIFTGEGI